MSKHQARISQPDSILDSIKPRLLSERMLWLTDLDGTLFQDQPGTYHPRCDDAFTDHINGLVQALNDLHIRSEYGVIAMTGRSDVYLRKLLQGAYFNALSEHGLYFHDSVFGQTSKLATAIDLYDTQFRSAYHRLIKQFRGPAGMIRLEENRKGTFSLQFNNEMGARSAARVCEEVIDILSRDNGFEHDDFITLRGNGPDERFVDLRHKQVRKSYALDRIMQMPDYKGRTPVLVTASSLDNDLMNNVQRRGGVVIGVGRDTGGPVAYSLGSAQDASRFVTLGAKACISARPGKACNA